MNEDNSIFSESSESSPEPSYTTPAEQVAAEPVRDVTAAYTEPVQTEQPAYSREASPAETAWTAPAQAGDAVSQKTKKAKKERRGMSAGAVIALCLVCAILGGAVSSGATYLATRSGNGSALGEALDSIVPTPVPVISTVSYDAAAVNDTAAAIYELAKQQVVGVQTDITYNVFGQTTVASVSGSGVILTEDGYILTNHHVVEDAIRGGYDVTVILYDETSYTAEIVGYDEDNDLALLKIDATGLNAAQLGDSDDLTVGQIIYAVGNPLGELSYSMTSGIVSATDRTITTENDVAMTVFQIDAAVNEGNSGGPVYNSLGQVIGIVSAKYADTGVEGLGFAIPINDAAHIANQLLEYGYVTDRAYLGITCATVTSAIAETYNMVEGAYVNDVAEDSAAEKAGLQTGDTITALNGEAVAGSSELTSMLRQYHAGDTATLTVSRDGQEEDLVVVFDAKPQETESETDASDSASGEPGQFGQDGQTFSYGDMEDFFRQFFGSYGFGR